MLSLSEALLVAGGVAIAWAIAAASPLLARHLEVIDLSKKGGNKRLEDQPVPLTGGYAVFVPTVLAMLYYQERTQSVVLLALALVTVGFVFIGYLDDRYQLAATPRLFFAIVVVWLAQFLVPPLSITFLDLSLGDIGAPVVRSATLITLVCVVGTGVFVNMADGKNGIVLGMALVWSGLFLALGLRDAFPFLPVLTAAIAVTLVFNLRGRLFLGDAGSGTLGVLFGFMAIYAHQARLVELPADAVAAWFWLPGLDSLRLILLRLRARRSPLSGDREHFHHLLYAALPEGTALATYLVLFAAPIGLCVYWPQLSYVWLLSMSGIYVAAVIALRGALSGRRDSH